MEPPQNPVDIKIVLGESEGQHNLANFNFNLALGEN